MPAEKAVHSRTVPPVSAVAAARIRLRMSSHPMTGQTLGNKWVSGFMTNSRPASAVTTPAAMMYRLVPCRSDPATISIRPAAISSPPIMSDEIVLPAGSNAAATPIRMIADAGDAQSPRPRQFRPSVMCPVATTALCSLSRTRRSGLRFPSGRDNSQRLPADPILQRRGRAHHFSVERHRQRRLRARDASTARLLQTASISSSCARLNSARMLAAMSPRRVFLRMT